MHTLVTLVQIEEKQNTQLYSSPSQAISGQAIDRHLLGLKMQAAEENLSVPDLFTDASYAKALQYRLSTSQVWAEVLMPNWLYLFRLINSIAC